VTIVDDIRALSHEFAAWLDGLPVEGPDVPLPDAEDLPEALLELAVPHEDINEVVAVHRAAPDLAPLRERCAWRVLEGLGTVFDGNPDLPALPPSLGAPARLLHVLVAVAVAPHTRRQHAAHGIDPAVTRHSLADVGRQVTKYRRRYGVPGVLTPSWLATGLRGQLFELGRLQFQRSRLDDRLAGAVARAGGPGVLGTTYLDLHIPDFKGPLTPGACDRSIDAAHAFFATHFPDDSDPVAGCNSWLLDRQLAAVLPAGSHIVAFQRRFRDGYPVVEPTDDAPLEFVFDDPSLPLDKQPRDTTLRRAILDHLAAGGHWYERTGWFAW
jgi:hypothetical protein